MGASQYPAHAVNGSYPVPYSSAESVSQYTYQSQARPAEHPESLPPLHRPDPTMQSVYDHQRAPPPPGPPASSGPPASMPQQYPQASQPGDRGAMYPISQYGSHSPYPTSSALMPPSTVAASHPIHPQPIAPAPPNNRGPVAPVLRPMPPHGSLGAHPQPGMPSPYGAMPPAPLAEDQPTHVVGSQGRRGILPSAPGRPPATPMGATGAKTTVIPQKDDDGKFPCPHCQKTYLHAKHLKRHLLRHTGDRPYMCVLCRDTFSRSDILKRHFQKCCIRRGNPQGVSHLSHPQAHVKKNAAAQQGQPPPPMSMPMPMSQQSQQQQQQQTQPAPTSQQQQQHGPPQKAPEGDLSHMNGGLGGLQSESMPHFGFQVSEGVSSVPADQAQLSRANSVSRLDNGNSQDRASVPAPGINAPSRSGSYGPEYNSNNNNGNNGGGGSGGVGSGMNQQIGNYNMQPGQNGMPAYTAEPNANHQAGLEWPQMFQSGAQPVLVSRGFPPNSGQSQIVTKPGHNADAGRAEGTPWASSHHQFLPFDHYGQAAPPPQDPYIKISTRILYFFSQGSTMTSQHSGLGSYFSPENTRNFLGNYKHFHPHFPFLHIATVQMSDTYTGLLAAICCVGACYSDHVPISDARRLTDLLREALSRHTRLFADPDDDDDHHSSFSAARLSASRLDVEELQAFVCMITLLVWNGTPRQRHHARVVYPRIASCVHRLGLFRVRSDGPGISPLHHRNPHPHRPDFYPRSVSPASFDWFGWIRQEERVRLAHVVFLCDTAMGLYFNLAPQFDCFDLQIPLPADDAAWDARSAEACAEALGLCGPAAVRLRNPNGTQQPTQPQADFVLQALLDSSDKVQPESTNLLGKFILIHAILSLIWKAVADGATPDMESAAAAAVAAAETAAAAASPTYPTDKTIRPAVPPASPHPLNKIATALDKYKKNWETDMSRQFPPSTVSGNPRRHGFSRDGIYFHWLAKIMIGQIQPEHLEIPSDERFAQVMHLVRATKAWVISDAASRGEELGSVGDMDPSYGVKSLTLDMVGIFKPLPSVMHDAIIPSIGPGMSTEDRAAAW